MKLRNGSRHNGSRRSASGALLPLAGVLLITASAQAAATPLQGKGDLFLRQTAAASPRQGWASVIVRLDGGGDLTPERRAQITRLGGYVYRHLPLIDAAAVRVPNRNLDELAALPFVTRVSSDATVHKADQFTVDSSEADVALTQQPTITGSGVGVAVIDSGVTIAPDLSGRVSASVNFVPNSSNANDLCGHGTHVAGIAAGNGASSSGPGTFRTFYGIARQAKIVNVRVLDGQGRGSVSNVVAGIQWVVNNKAAHNIRVINLSLGHPVGESYTTDPLCRAVEQAWKAGVVVVCSAGNTGRTQNTQSTYQNNEGYGTNYGSVQSPGNSPYAITVGAMKSVGGGRVNDRVATYSSRGPSRLDIIAKPDLVAPGNRVVSLAAANSYLYNSFGANLVKQSEYSTTTNPNDSVKYFRLNGTSMAAPVVSGAVALMLHKTPSLSPDTVKARLMLTADKVGFPDGSGDACTFGAGYLNVARALASTAVATQYALSPKMYQDANGNVYLDQNSIYGTKAIWGTGVTDLKAIWGTRAIWGTNTLSSSKAIWGTSVWSDKAIWGTSTDTADLSSTAIYGEN